MTRTATIRHATAGGMLLVSLLGASCRDEGPADPGAGSAQLSLSPANQQLLATIKAATARYQNVDVARANG